MRHFRTFLNWVARLFKSSEEPSKQVEQDDLVVQQPRVVTEQTKKAVLKKGDIGVDISHHNRDVNLDELARNVDFIYMKATEGTSFVSSAYVSRAAKLKKIGIAWGAYHYYKVNSDPITQAKHFLKYIDVESGLPPVLDIEGINNNFKSKHTKDLLLFMNEIEKVTGITPIMYTGYYYAKGEIKPTKEFSRFPLWIAWYTKDFGRVKVPSPWKEMKIWQYTESGYIAGVNGKVDINKVVS